MGGKAIERLAKAIGYPDRVPDGVVSFVFRVDGAEIAAAEMDGRLVLSRLLSDDASLLPTLATYAAGRMLKEEAVLSYGDGRAFIWQEASADADAHGLTRLFETFMDSCDWWWARIDALRGSGTSEASMPETVMIRP